MQKRHVPKKLQTQLQTRNVLVAFQAVEFARVSWYHTAEKEALLPLAMTTVYVWHIDKTRGIVSLWQHKSASHRSMLD